MTYTGNPYPRRYTARLQSKIIFGGAGALMVVAGIYGTFYFGSGHEVHSLGGKLLAVGLSIGAIAFGVYVALGIFADQLILRLDTFKLPGFFGGTTVQRSDIKGYRMHHASGMTVMYVEHSQPGNSKLKKTRITLIFEVDQFFEDWFKGILNLDYQEYFAAEQEVIADERAGDSPEQRRDNLEQARKVAKALVYVLIAAAAVVMISFFSSTIRIPIVLQYSSLLLLILLPWISVAIAGKSPAIFTLKEPRPGEAKASLGITTIMPCVLLGLAAIRISLMSPAQLIIPSLVAVLLGTLVLSRVMPYKSLKDLQHIGGTSLLFIPYFASTLALADVKLDRHPVITQNLHVLHVKVSAHKQPSYTLVLEPLGSKTKPWSIDVSKKRYEMSLTSRQLCLRYHKGALGMDWYSLCPIEDI